jgi:hypothetical protein
MAMTLLTTEILRIGNQSRNPLLHFSQLLYRILLVKNNRQNQKMFSRRRSRKLMMKSHLLKSLRKMN